MSLGRWVMNHPLISGLEQVILVRMSSSSRPLVRRAEREVTILAEDLLVDLRVSESLLGASSASETNFLKISVFHVVPVDIGEIKILLEFLRILSSLHLSSLLDGRVFELLESVLGEGRNLDYLGSSQPLGPLRAAGAGKEGEKAHLLSPESLIV